jgi:hypothetical protein
MDPTLNADAHPRLTAMRSVRSWRSGQWLLARLVTLIVPILVFLAWCFLAIGNAQARVQIDFDPMRPPPAASAAAPAAGGTAAAEAASAAPALPTLKITRMTGSAGVLSALVDDTWVRRGDVVAGYRVTTLRTESVDLVNLADPTQRLTLRLNPVAVERPTEGSKPPTAWPSLALEKK